MHEEFAHLSLIVYLEKNYSSKCVIQTVHALCILGKVLFSCIIGYIPLTEHIKAHTNIINISYQHALKMCVDWRWKN